MIRSTQQLRNDALAIWQAGVDAVRSDALIRAHVRVAEDVLTIGDDAWPLDQIDRIAVVGCGKAGAGMAAGLEKALGQQVLADKRVAGWVNVPDDCVRPLNRIHLHGARPPGINEPTQAGVDGADQILELVRGLNRRDLCICLISGGGSALLPAPVSSIRLEDKLDVTRHLSGSGANIQQLNTVRKHLSRIKGGGLAGACRAGQMIVLIISDVLGDPLDVIASGPTVPDPSTAGDALAVLEQFDSRQAGISDAVFNHLQQADKRNSQKSTDAAKIPVTHHIIGNNATAVEAAAREAIRRGYATTTDAADRLEGQAESIGRRLAASAVAMRDAGRPACLVSGGEPTVRLLPAEQRGLGGRNQQLVLAAFAHLATGPRETAQNLVLLSGGTDGEDGPTDAAGAWLDQRVVRQMQAHRLEPQEFLRRNDAYHFFDPLEALIRTGPTHTNVCDLRIVLVGG
jgi:glycerate 2-kinase